MSDQSITALIGNAANTRIKQFGEELAAVLLTEYQQKVKVVKAEAELKDAKIEVVSAAEQSGSIDGGNADTRKAQRAAVIAESPWCNDLCAALIVLEREVDKAEIERRQVEAVISLTKAWPYSQGGHNKIVNMNT